MTTRLPHPAGVLGALAGAAVALAPGSLPRTVTVHAVLLTACLLLGAAIGTVFGRLLPDGPAAMRARSRKGVIGVAAATFIVMVGADVWWQDTLRDDLNRSGTGLVWWAASFAPVVIYSLIVAAPRITTVALTTVAAGAVSLTPAVAAPSGTDMSRAAAFEATDATATSLRLYSPLDGRTLQTRAADLVARWSAAGGARRASVVVAVPTGSGWVDPDAVRGFEERLHGDVSVLAVQYDDIPSWQAFVSGSGPARNSAIAVTSEVLGAIARLPGERRPQVYLYGQSLGAIGADAARAWTEERHVRICATILAGPPSGSVAAQARRRVVVANASDPVTRWSPRLIWRPADRWAGRSDLPRPVWSPVASFVQASADLMGALSFPAGHGHQYGTEQGTLAPVCTDRTSDGGQTSGPRAASYAAPTR